MIGIMIEGFRLAPLPILLAALIANAAATIGGLQFPDTANYRLLDTENDGIYEALAVDVDVDVDVEVTQGAGQSRYLAFDR